MGCLTQPKGVLHVLLSNDWILDKWTDMTCIEVFTTFGGCLALLYTYTYTCGQVGLAPCTMCAQAGMAPYTVCAMVNGLFCSCLRVLHTHVVCCCTQFPVVVCHVQCLLVCPDSA